jgi:hypothetical protein|tara:strand:- start:924 stop:1109 length:186 start_codon:yes stop_codon:yes gene_type:complete
MGFNYEKERAEATLRTVKRPNENLIFQAQKVGFPNCKGLFPDCPEKPSLKKSMCRSCPVND